MTEAAVQTGCHVYPDVDRGGGGGGEGSALVRLVAEWYPSRADRTCGPEWYRTCLPGGRGRSRRAARSTPGSDGDEPNGVGTAAAGDPGDGAGPLARDYRRGPARDRLR